MSDIKIIDMHTHTDNSPDGNHSAMYMAEIAEANGIECVAFTDHCEVIISTRMNMTEELFRAFSR